MAKRLGVSRSELFQRAMKSYLNEHREDRVTEKLDAVYKKGARDKKLDPFLEKLQGASLEREKWECKR